MSACVNFHPPQFKPVVSCDIGYVSRTTTPLPEVKCAKLVRRGSVVGILNDHLEEKLYLKNPNDQRISVTTASMADPFTIVCVIGVGYVGETLLSEFGEHYQTIGFDISASRVALLQKCYAENKNITVTNSASSIAEATHFLISVPTLLNPDNSINSKHLSAAIKTVIDYARPGSTVVIESSVSIGMTRQLLAPYIHKFQCGMSPERVDPGRVSPAPSRIPKVISGLTSVSLAAIHELYRPVFQRIVPVSSPEVAEMTKLYENCFRMVNIAYVNEIADACSGHGIDIEEVVRAASTKPFGYMPFSPGIGVGGHCIPINPHYLALNCSLPILEKSTKLMSKRPGQIASQFYNKVDKQIESAKVLRQPRILVVGMAFKPGQSLLTMSPSIDFSRKLKKMGCEDLAFYDPLVSQGAVQFMRKVENEHFNVESLKRDFDAVAICMKQIGVDESILISLKDDLEVKWF